MDSLEQGKNNNKRQDSSLEKNPGIYKMLSSSGEILYIEKQKIFQIDLKVM